MPPSIVDVRRVALATVSPASAARLSARAAFLVAALALGPAVPAVAARPSALTVPPTITAEATSPDGAVVTFQVASDDPNAQVACNPPSNSVFPLGATTVTCTAGSDSASFMVIIVDSRPPVISRVPKPIVLQVNGVRSAVVTYAKPVAVDVVDGPVRVTCSPPPKSAFPLGTTSVSCTAVDKHGNSSSTSFRVRVLDVVPPPKPTDVIVRSSPATIALSWRLQRSMDVAGVEVLRYPGRTVVYRGRASSIVDSHVRPGGSYRYSVASYDWAGNSSARAAVAAVAKRTKLIAPQNAAELTLPPLLQWQPVPGAAYYNVQLWLRTRSGLQKILSVWPRTNRLRLKTEWTFGGRKHTLTKGRYTWYVWPGFGVLADAHYGELIGASTFFVVG
jgi:hypothetical protein